MELQGSPEQAEPVLPFSPLPGLFLSFAATGNYQYFVDCATPAYNR